MRESFHRPFCIRFLWPNKVWGVRAFFFRKILFSTNPRRLSIIFVNLFLETFLMCFWILMKFFTRSDALLLLPQLFFFCFYFDLKLHFLFYFLKLLLNGNLFDSNGYFWKGKLAKVSCEWSLPTFFVEFGSTFCLYFSFYVSFYLFGLKVLRVFFFFTLLRHSYFFFYLL